MRRSLVVSGIMFLGFLFLHAGPATAQPPVVRAVLFFSPTCPHCRKVMTEDLPPLIDRFGDQLVILAVDTTKAGGQVLFRAAMEYYDVPRDQYFVPALAVGGRLLVGDQDIPEQFPGIVEQGIAAGGIDWPEVAGLAEAIASLPEESPSEGKTPEPGNTQMAENAETARQNPGGQPPAKLGLSPLPETPLSVAERIGLDPLGNFLSMGILLGMAALLIMVAIFWFSRPQWLPSSVPHWIVPLLSIAGIGIAGYLTYVEMTQTPAVCGPVGDCNVVQQTQYAWLAGDIPVALLGLIGYIAILFGSLLAMRTKGKISLWSSVAIFVFALIGTLYSTYLTFLEPFAIGAACAWCLSSAVIIAAQMWLSSGRAKVASMAILARGEREAA